MTPAVAPSSVVVATDLPGPEDLLVHETARGPRLLVSSARRALRGPAGGQIFSVPIAADGELGLPAPLTPPSTINPVGLSLSAGPGSEASLYTIFRGASGAEVRRYELQPSGELLLRAALTSPLLVSPNDLVALPSGEIYVTNDGSGRPLLAPFEALLGLRTGRVVHFRPERNPEWLALPLRVSFANGIAVNREGDLLIIAEFRQKRILVFARSPTGEIDPASRRSLTLGIYPDNLSWDAATGDLLVAGHRSLVRTFAQLVARRRIRAPWAVYRVSPHHLRSPPDERVQPLLEGDGIALAAVSVAAIHDHVLYLGQLSAEGIGVCRLQPALTAR